MGCANSKPDDLPAVALCRDRCNDLDEAIRQRFAFAEAHMAYIHSLKRIGNSLHSFIEQDYGTSSGVTAVSPSSPKLNLPPQRKGDPVTIINNKDEGTSSPKKQNHHFYHSDSGSHLDFHSDSDDEDDSISPLHPLDGPHGNEYVNSYDYNMMMNMDPQNSYMRMNYMKNKATPPTVVYQQRPMNSENVYFSEPSSSSSYHYPNNSSYHYSSYPYSNYPYYGAAAAAGGGGGGEMSGFYDSSSLPPPPAVASSSKPPPPPPSPPRASAWEFFNLFESDEKFYPQYTPRRNSREVREEEGIPDLEDEEFQHEVVKEVHGGEKYIGNGGNNKHNYSKAVMMDDDGDAKIGGGGDVQASPYQTRPSGVSMENDRVEYEVHMVSKKVVDNERSEEHGSGGFKARGGGLRDASQVAFEIKILFERASDCGNEIAKMLEVGTLRYQRKYVSKMLHGVTPSLSAVSTSKSTEASTSTDKAGPPVLEIDEDLAIRSKNLSSTLQKLYLWEKKLYHEVKAEEKMRVLHDKKCRKLKHLDERGAEAHKVDATRTLIRSLSTKIRMAIQVVDKISDAINKIRDEELWPQLNELIQGLTRMWKSMLECHHNQCQAIREARSFSPIGLGKKLSDDRLRASLQLERELLNWTSSFSGWIGAQRAYVKALNGWLFKCLFYEPEDTPDGPVPFSPGRLGAPPVFVICNQWAQAMDRISEKEVIGAMRIFSKSVLQIWEQDKLEMHQRMMTSKDLERKVRNLDREDQKIQKEIQALEKKIVLVSGDGHILSVTGKIVFQSDTSNTSLRESLQRIFEAMERFTSDSMKAYEELVQRSEEERLAREHERVS